MGNRLGQYELVEEIGRGGMAVVYRARQPHADRDVAVKVISPDYARYPSVIRRFEGEARAAARLQHPHILPVYDVGVERGQPYLVMAYTPGGTLSKRLAALPRRAEGDPSDPRIPVGMPLATVVRLTAQIATALDYAHAHGVVHCDVKPGNVLLDEQGFAYLADFGIARLASDVPELDGHTPGTYAYMAPEVAAGDAPGPASDVYALGIMVFEMLTGCRPYEAHDRRSVVEMAGRAPPDLLALRPDLPPGVRVVVSQALSPQPESRPAHAGSLALALARAAGLEQLVCAPGVVDGTDAAAGQEGHDQPARKRDQPGAVSERATPTQPTTPPPDVPGWIPPDEIETPPPEESPAVQPPATASSEPTRPQPRLLASRERAWRASGMHPSRPDRLALAAWVIGLVLLAALVAVLVIVLASWSPPGAGLIAALALR